MAKPKLPQTFGKVQEPMAGAPFSPYRKLTVSARKGSGAATANEIKKGYRPKGKATRGG